MAWHLQLADGTLARDKLPEFIPLGPGTTRVGRGSGVVIDPKIDDIEDWAANLVSGHHADFVVDAEGKLTLTDCSTNGTEVDGVGIDKGSTVSLEHGNVLVLGTRGPDEQGRKRVARRRAFCQQYFRFIVRAGDAPGSVSMQSPLGVVDAATARVNTQVAARSVECSQASAMDVDTAAATPVGSAMDVEAVTTPAAPATNSSTADASASSSSSSSCLLGPSSTAAGAAQPSPDGAAAGHGPLLSPAAAAARLGYEDCHALGCFKILEDSSSTGGSVRRTPVAYAAHEALPTELSRTLVDYQSLRAFETTDGRGWGVCCATAIGKGDLVVEAIGYAAG